MTDLAHALRELVEPSLRGDRVKVAIDRASRLTGLSYWRTFDLWYGKAKRIEQSEREAVATALEQKRRESARNELQELRIRLTRLEALLVTTDPDFHRPTIDLARDHLRQMGRAGGTTTPKKPPR